MAKEITIINADRGTFRLLVDGVEVPGIGRSVLQESVEVLARRGHSVVRLELIAEQVMVANEPAAAVA
jgi:hypothetical protein